mgnify:FL=1
MKKQNTVPDNLKEWCACVTMRDMLLKLAEKKQITYEEALLQFTASPTYEALFDFSTAIWKEGPDYLFDMYERYSKQQNVKIAI